MKLIEKDGWYLAVTKGSHRQYKHSIKHKAIKQWKENGDAEGNWRKLGTWRKLGGNWWAEIEDGSGFY